jgi:hypothetical protein
MIHQLSLLILLELLAIDIQLLYIVVELVKIVQHSCKLGWLFGMDCDLILLLRYYNCELLDLGDIDSNFDHIRYIGMD